MWTYFETDSGKLIATQHPNTWSKAKRLPRKEAEQRIREHARDRLLEILKPGDTVLCILRHVSRSGMRRRIDLYKCDAGEMLYLSQLANEVMKGKPFDDRRGSGITVDGCGMDMGFDLVYRLGYCLWPNGTDKPHGTRNGEPDSNGGYALKHRWV